jgi:hypothetical protein
MFKFPNKTAQEVRNLMRLRLLELEARKYLVIKETIKIKPRTHRDPN